VEVLQEQGRWTDSLKWLEDDLNHERADLKTVFTLHANCFTNSHPAEAIQRNIETLIKILRTSSDLATCARAARVASRFLTELRDKTTAAKLLKHIQKLPVDNIPERESTELSIAKALCLYHSHKREASLTVLLSTSRHLRNTGRINSGLCSLLLGLGAIRCQQGRYNDALTEFTHGHEVATRIGNDLLQTHSAAQVALCYCRLGQYSTVLEWTNKAQITSVEFSGYIEIQSAYYSALAYNFCGKPELATATIIALDSRVPDSAPHWLRQAWYLFKADILYITGQQQTAISLAKDGIGRRTPVLHSPFFAGGFSRWLALTADSSTSRDKAIQLITELTYNISTFDTLDQAEILCAEYNLRRDELSDAEREKHQTLITHRLDLLPSAVRQQLRTLGMLQP